MTLAQAVSMFKLLVRAKLLRIRKKQTQGEPSNSDWAKWKAAICEDAGSVNGWVYEKGSLGLPSSMFTGDPGTRLEYAKHVKKLSAQAASAQCKRRLTNKNTVDGVRKAAENGPKMDYPSSRQRTKRAPDLKPVMEMPRPSIFTMVISRAT